MSSSRDIRIASAALILLAPCLLAQRCEPERRPVDEGTIDTEQSDAEVQAAATDPSEGFPDGRVYLSANHYLHFSTNGGETFESVPWNGLRDINELCPAPLGFRGDTDVAVPRGFLAPGGFQHAYAVALYGLAVPTAIAVVRTGSGGRFDDKDIQCMLVQEPEPVGLIDKTSAVLDNFLEDALYVTYQDGRSRKAPIPDTDVGHNWLQKIRLSAQDGSLEQVEAPRMLQAPGEDGPAETIWGNCKAQKADDMGRGNLFATANGTLYLAFSNNLEANCSLETRRIYVARITGKNQYISCVDEFFTTDCAEQGHIEESDPELVVDPQSNKIAVVYAKPGFETDSGGAGRRVVVATADLEGHDWYRQLVYSGEPSDGDQTQPSIALTTFSDAISRVFSGTIFVTWYQPAKAGRVDRQARGFYSSGNGWRANTAAFRISTGPFFPIDPDIPYPKDPTHRGVFEYQGVTHHPAMARGDGGWVGAWTQPSPPELSHPLDAYRIAYATWH